MTDPDDRILDRVRASVDSGLLRGAIVYLDPDAKRAGERLAVGDAVVDAPWPCHIVFLDIEPQANWGHACAYLAVRLDGDEIITVAATMPPFLKADASAFRLLWRGPSAPEWAVATA